MNAYPTPYHIHGSFTHYINTNIDQNDLYFSSMINIEKKISKGKPHIFLINDNTEFKNDSVKPHEQRVIDTFLCWSSCR